MMKVKTIIFSAAIALSATAVSAQVSPDYGADSIQCLEDISLFTTDAKNRDYASALAPWERAYANCPASTKNIYIHGSAIVMWQFEQETDPAEKAALVEKLMKLYDDRIKYFGDDPNYGPDMITALRIADYMKMVGAAIDYEKIYKWTSDVVEKMGERVNPQLLYYYLYASLSRAVENAEYKEQYIEDYMLVSEALEKKLQANPDSTQQQVIIAIKNPMDDYFARSGLADCETLVKLYTPRYEANKSNVEFLESMLTMFRMADCEDNTLYTKASRSLFNIRPTAGAAMGLAQEALKAKKYNEAVDFLKQASTLTNNQRDRATIEYTIGLVYMNQSNYSAARNQFNKSLQLNPNNGRALLNIAIMYGNTIPNLYTDDRVMQRACYNLVIDKLERARSIDSSVASEAANLIAQYRRNLPSSADIFMHPELEQGQSIHVGGWIGESTRVR